MYAWDAALRFAAIEKKTKQNKIEKKKKRRKESAAFF
jgi:hypothetical protein